MFLMRFLMSNSSTASFYEYLIIGLLVFTENAFTKKTDIDESPNNYVIKFNFKKFKIKKIN